VILFLGTTVNLAARFTPVRSINVTGNEAVAEDFAFNFIIRFVSVLLELDINSAFSSKLSIPAQPHCLKSDVIELFLEL
jgi:hypothetical protein